MSPGSWRVEEALNGGLVVKSGPEWQSGRPLHRHGRL